MRKIKYKIRKVPKLEDLILGNEFVFNKKAYHSYGWTTSRDCLENKILVLKSADTTPRNYSKGDGGNINAYGLQFEGL